MPIMNSFGALKQQRYSVATTSPATYWYSINAFKNNSNGYNVNLSIINSQLQLSGSNGGPPDARPYSAILTNTSGALSSYKVYADVTAFPYNNSYTRAQCQDSSGNNYYFMSSFQINKYNSSNTFVSGTTILNNSSGGLDLTGAVKGSTDHVYTITLNASDFILCKISLSTLTVTWSKQVSGITIDNSIQTTFHSLYIDSSDNTYVTIWTSGTSTYTIFKFDSSGVLQWQKSHTQFTGGPVNQSLAVDNFLNVYLFGRGSGTNGVIIKLDSSGVFQSARTATTPNGVGTYDGMILNSDGNITLFSDSQSGSFDFTYTCVMSTSYSIVSTTRISQTNSGAFFVPLSIISNSGSLYIVGTIEATASALTVLKVPNNNTTYFSTPYTYSFTNDGGTVHSGSGTWAFTNIANPTLTSQTYTITTTAYSSASYTTNSTTNSAPTLNSTAPYNKNGTLV